MYDFRKKKNSRSIGAQEPKRLFVDDVPTLLYILYCCFCDGVIYWSDKFFTGYNNFLKSFYMLRYKTQEPTLTK
jgi:hypothetical protein